MAAAPAASNRRDTFTFISSAAARWETAPRGAVSPFGLTSRPLPGVGRLGRLCGRFGGAGSRRPPRAHVRQLRYGQCPLALVHAASLEIQAGRGQRRVPGGDGPHGLPRDRHTRPFARKRAAPAVE